MKKSTKAHASTLRLFGWWTMNFVTGYKHQLAAIVDVDTKRVLKYITVPCYKVV